MMRSACSRRRVLAAGGGLSLTALLSACGVVGGVDEGGGSWSFKDDRGKKAEVDGAPQRVVAYIGAAAALWDYGVREQIVGVFGPTKKKNGEPDVQAGDVDVSKVEVLGNTFGEFNLQKYAKLDPQLLATHITLKDSLWYVPDESLDEVEKLAPTIGIETTGNVAPDLRLDEVIQRHWDLAEALGADMKAKTVRSAKQDFDDATTALAKIAKRQSDLKVMALSADNDMVYICDPKNFPDLRYFEDQGVKFVVPEETKDAFWEEVSWENIDKYNPDVVLVDERSSSVSLKEMADKPTWAELPAVQAQQVVSWLSEPRFSHSGCAPLLTTLAEGIEKAKPVD